MIVVLCIFGIVTSVPLIVLGDGFVVLKHRDIIELVVLLATLVFHLDALFKLSLKSLLSVQCKRRLLVPLLLLIDLLRTLICIVTLLFAVEAHNSHVLHLTHRVQFLDVKQLCFSDFHLLAISRFVTIQSTPVTNDFVLILSHEVMMLSTMHGLRHVDFAIDPILFIREVSQCRE